MVKIDSTIGMKFKGKIGDFIIQDVNGQQVLRKGYKENKIPTKEQVEVRNRFRDAAAWVKSLSPEEKKELRRYFRTIYTSYEKGQPSTWYNWAKTLHMTTPDFQVLDSVTFEYSIKHPGILKIEEFNSSGVLIHSATNLSSILDSQYLTFFTNLPQDGVTSVRLTTISGAIYEYGKPITVITPVDSCFPCMRSTCLEYRAIEVDAIKDDCWQIIAETMTDGLPSDCEYNHFV